MDFLEDAFGGMDESAVKELSGDQPAPQQNSYQNNNSNQNSSNNYQKNNNNNYQNNQSSKGGWNKGGNNDWRKKQDEIKPPYLPIAIFIANDFPEEVKQSLIKVADKLISLGYTVRFNADELPIYQQITGFSRAFTEGYVPFKGFNDIESNFCWKTKTSEDIAMKSSPVYDRLPKLVKLLIERNVRLLFGSRNNSPAKCVVTWSPDGAVRGFEVSYATGYARGIIELAYKYKYPIYNLNNEDSRKDFNITFIEGEGQ